MHDAYKEPHAWHGRTRWQVEQDNQQMALKEGVWQNNEATPRDPKPDQQFWCIELDGSKTLRTADTIENALRPGRWHKDPFYGNMYYVRAPKEAEAGKVGCLVLLTVNDLTVFRRLEPVVEGRGWIHEVDHPYDEKRTGSFMLS